jgi:hypothetical protein
MVVSCVLFLVFVIPAEAGFVVNGFGIYTGALDQKDPRIVSDGYGGAIIVWEDHAAGYRIVAQRIDAMGRPLWGDQGVIVCDETGEQSDPLVVADGSGGAIALWGDDRDGDRDIYGQRLDSSGTIQWAAAGAGIVTGDGDQYLECMIPGEGGGAIVAWTDWGDGFSDIKVFVQRIDNGGALLWTASGVSVSNAAGNQEEPCIAPNGSGGAIVTWQDSRSGSDIYAQAVTSSGSVAWDVGGAVVCAASEGQYAPVMVSDRAGGAVVAWTDYRRGDFHSDVYAQRIDGAGAALWTAGGVSVCAASGDQWSEAMCEDGSGGAIIAWADDRSSGDDVYAQRVDANGARLWTLNGVPVCAASGSQWYIRIVSDSAAGAIVSWVDSRSGVPSNYDIYVQRIGSSGLALWTPNGVPVCTAADDQSDAEPVGDGEGGAFLVWEDRRSGNYDIYGARVDSDGDPVATLLSSYSIALDGLRPRVTWTLIEQPGNRRFFVLRSIDDRISFVELACAAVTVEEHTCSFLDTGCEPGADCIYRVEMLDEGERTFLLEAGPIHVPALGFRLLQNHPNPFNPSTTIEYVLPAASWVLITVYDTRGRLVARLADEDQQAGPHAIVWNGLDTSGTPLPSGVYFYRLEAGKLTQTRKMIILR